MQDTDYITRAQNNIRRLGTFSKIQICHRAKTRYWHYISLMLSFLRRGLELDLMYLSFLRDKLLYKRFMRRINVENIKKFVVAKNVLRFSIRKTTAKFNS